MTILEIADMLREHLADKPAFTNLPLATLNLHSGLDAKYRHVLWALQFTLPEGALELTYVGQDADATKAADTEAFGKLSALFDDDVDNIDFAQMGLDSSVESALKKLVQRAKAFEDAR